MVLTRPRMPRLSSLPLAWALALACAMPAPSAHAARPAGSDIPGQNAEDALLWRIFADDARRAETVDPLNTLYHGEPVEPADLDQLYTDQLDRKRLASARHSLAALGKVDRRRLSPEGISRRCAGDVSARSPRPSRSSTG